MTVLNEMMEIASGGAKLRSYKSVAEIDTIAQVWDSLRIQERRFVPSFADTKKGLQESGFEFCFITVEDNCSVVGIACFINGRSTKNFSFGERLSFCLPVRETRLYFSSVLGRVNESALKAVLRRAAQEWPCDLMVLAEVELNSPLLSAATSLGGGLVPTRPGWKRSVRWFINLPSSFDEYLKSLRPSTTSEILRKSRALERYSQYQLRIFTRTNELEQFLRDGEEICRRTYHWTVGQRLQNDDQTRERYLRLAAAGRLRAYVLYMDAKPCAFARGEISGALYHSETPGFDPAFHKLSPGMVLLMWTIRDLIDNTQCTLFDFGSGGDYTSFKERFSNYHFDCDRIDICNIRAPYSLFLFVVHQMLFSMKRLLRLVLGIGGVDRKMTRLDSKSAGSISALKN